MTIWETFTQGMKNALDDYFAMLVPTIIMLLCLQLLFVVAGSAFALLPFYAAYWTMLFSVAQFLPVIRNFKFI